MRWFALTRVSNTSQARRCADSLFIWCKLCVGIENQQVPGEADRAGDLSTMTNASTAASVAGDLWNGLVVRLLTFCKNETDTKSVCSVHE